MAFNNSGTTITLRLRDRLFLSYALLSVIVLLAAAYAINRQVIAQARQQVQEEMRDSLPLYEAVWEEQTGRLTNLGLAMAGSPIVKTVLGDPRASRDRETIRQMLGEFGPNLAANVDLILITDGSGSVVFSQLPRSMDAGPAPAELPGAKTAASSQKSAQSFLLLGGRIFHVVWTPVMSHSGEIGFDNTLAVLVIGSELTAGVAQEIRKKARSDVLFIAGGSVYASSLVVEKEQAAAQAIASAGAVSNPDGKPFEMTVSEEPHLAFVRTLPDIDGKSVGSIFVLHSLASAGRLFRAISNRLTAVGSIGLALILMLSYFIARRITRPVESLVAGALEFGRGNYDAVLIPGSGGELGQLATAFDQMRRSIREGQAVLLKNERLATIGKMASGIVHDLRSPLAAISTSAELFGRADLSPAQRKMLAESQLRSAERMGTMMRELLEFSRGRYDLKTSSLNLSSLLHSIVDDLITAESYPNVTVDLDVPSDLVIRADEGRIRRLFQNLLVNSIQAMPSGGVISISALSVDKWAVINVVDSGAGIPAGLRDKLFEPFSTSGKQGGSGLGLAIASGIVEAHGGKLELVSAPDEPADFRIELPIYSGA
jgi:signal transduction histidine kinase